MICEKNNSNNNHHHHHHHHRHKIMIVIIVIVICSRVGSEHCIAQRITSATFLSFHPNCRLPLPLFFPFTQTVKRKVASVKRRLFRRLFGYGKLYLIILRLSVSRIIENEWRRSICRLGMAGRDPGGWVSQCENQVYLSIMISYCIHQQNHPDDSLWPDSVGRDMLIVIYSSVRFV